MLILASSSPRRRELLQAAGIPHRVQAPDIVELRQSGESPTGFIRRMASEKSAAVPIDRDDIALGADTVVCIGDQLFCKPVDQDQAASMLRALSGRRHWVHTGVCLRTSNRVIIDSASTAVDLVELSDHDIEAYTLSGEGRDKAGAYAIQGLASRYVWSVEGSYTNVVGLPVSLVYRHLRELHYL